MADTKKPTLWQRRFEVLSKYGNCEIVDDIIPNKVVDIEFTFPIPDDGSYIHTPCEKKITTTIYLDCDEEIDLEIVHWLTYSQYKTEGNCSYTYDELIKWLEDLTKKVADNTITEYNC